jgi:hypothetical protein
LPLEFGKGGLKILGIGFLALFKSGADDVGESIFKYSVGHYKDLKVLGRGTGLDAHHVGQKAIMKKLVPDYSVSRGPSILVPRLGHTRGSGVVSRSMSSVSNARQLLARDILELRRVYPDIPNQALQTLIDMNRSMFPRSFSK